MKTAKTRNVHRVKRLTALLLQEYGLPKLGNKRNPLDELVFILLSEKTDEKKYRKAYANLKASFGTWNAVRTAKLADIRKAIDCAGMGQRRAKLIRGMLRSIVARHGKLTLSWLKGMKPDEAERALLALPGVGKKAARCVLLYCFDMPVLPVDIHTFRLGVRLGLVSRRVSYDAAHAVLQEAVPAESRHGFHVAAVAHGRTRCHAIDPRCDGCCLRRSCSHVRAEKPLPVAVRPKPLVVDLFAGAGGMSVGFQEAGFAIAQAVEEDPRVATTYRHNHRNTDVVQEDIRTVDPKALSYANIIGQAIVSKWCPLTWQAFVDFQLQAVSFSRLELEIIRALHGGDTATAVRRAEEEGLLAREEQGFRRSRERDELEEKLSVIGLEVPWRETR